MDTSNPLTPDSSSFQDVAEPHQAVDPNSGALAALADREHPAVLGARLGACLFSSFVFPTLLWTLGAATPAFGAAIAVLMTVIGSRPLLLVGGPKIVRVVLLQIALGAVLLSRVTSPWLGIPAAVFLPLVGMLATVWLVARIAEYMSTEDHRPHEVEAAVARAMQSNVVDIRSAEAARRASKKARGQVAATPAAPSLQSQL